jgi:hypothetical protein
MPSLLTFKGTRAIEWLDSALLALSPDFSLFFSILSLDPPGPVLVLWTVEEKE